MATLPGLWVRSASFIAAGALVCLLSPAPAQSAASSLVVSNYSKPLIVTQSNGLPKGWKLRIWAGEPDVKVIRENGKNVLRLRSRVSSLSLYKDLTVNLKNYPHLKWRWKVTKLPKNADARVNNRDDQAAGVYVVFPRFPKMINTQLLAYIWETSAPVGSILRNKKNPALHYIVVRSGKGRLNEWITEERNVIEDYRQVFGEDPPMVGGVALLIDSDDTHSQAESYFAKIEFLKRSHVQLPPPANQLVKSIIPKP